MKKLFTLIAILALLVSCTDEPVGIPFLSEEGDTEIVQSKGLRPILERIKDVEGINGKSKTTLKNKKPLDFSFIYPLTLQFNDESVTQVMDYHDLVNRLKRESLGSHVVAIGFPFEIRKVGTIENIPMYDNRDLTGLASSYELEMVDYNYMVERGDTCYEIKYPITLIVNNVPATFKVKNDADNYFNGTVLDSGVAIEYPYEITYLSSKETKVLTSDYEALQTVKNSCN
ncbi:MAG: hypothetical protein WBG71_15545 [Leeuwenhoekiella sp.]